MFNDVSTVFKLDEAGLRIILVAEENLSDLFVITDATFCRTFVSAQADTRVAAIQLLAAGFGARRTIAWLVAQLATALVGALPSTGLTAWDTGLSTWLHALAVAAAILTWPLTRGAVTGAGLPARVGANQETLTLVITWHMEASLITHVTVPRTNMAAFQHMCTSGPT